MEAITIRITASDDNGGYTYDIYKEDLTDGLTLLGESADGGLCTTTMLDALEMAADQAANLIKRERGDECAGCNADMNQEGIGKYDYRCDDGLHLHVCKECSIRHHEEGDFISER